MTAKHRIRIFQSTSAKLALSLSSLLLCSLILLCVEVYRFSHGNPIQPIIIYSILAVVICICGSLFYISYHVLNRINAIVDTADNIITTRDLTQRIHIDNPWDDLSKLSQVLNTMLAQIDHSVTSIRQVSDNIAHDLRTPLTRLRNDIENLKFGLGGDEQKQLEINELVIECDGILSTFNALLRIANIESGRMHPTFHLIDLMPVAEDVIELYEPFAAEKQIHLHLIAEPTITMGDKDLLFQAMANLLDNAIKHTPANGTITLRLSTNTVSNKAIITVSDTGCGIPDNHKEHVFRRFYRTESARNTPGAGLGLSLVSAIVTLHHGVIKLSDNTPTGLVVTTFL